MTVFAAALDCLFSDPNLALSAVWISAATSEERPIRVVRRAPDAITGFGAARLLSDTTIVEVRLADLPDPVPGDLIVLGSDSFVIQGEPQRDRERLLWRLDLHPA